jgi:malate dehydrogenase (oxaloacetate-decarboxylating)
MKKDINKQSLILHKKLNGKIGVYSKAKIKNKKDLSLVYTPGVAAVSSYLQKHKHLTGSYTMKNNFIAVVSDGSAVLGLGNIGPEGALPVMEGKCVLFKHFADINAIPIVLSTQDPDEIINTVVNIAPNFGGINLEDISAPKCFYIEETLKSKLNIPVFHDDQWGASIVVLAALINALKIAKKELTKTKIVVCGAGAAGSSIVKILYKKGAKNILVCDQQGIIYRSRKGNADHKEKLAKITNPQNIKGTLHDAMKLVDVFIGVSSPGIVLPGMVSSMNKNPIVFALANPIPEIMPDKAKKAGALIVATGRSDFKNQVNNALVFPGIFRGALDHKVKKITMNILIKAADNLSRLVKKPTPEKIIPSIFDKGVVKAVSSAII